MTASQEYQDQLGSFGTPMNTLDSVVGHVHEAIARCDVDMRTINEMFDQLAELSFMLDGAIMLVGAGQFTSNRDVSVLTTLRIQGGQRPRDLAQLTGLTSGGVTNLIDRLVSSGLVERQRLTTGDRRGVRIELTDTGRRTVARVAAAAGRVLTLATPLLDRWRNAFLSMDIDVGPLPRSGGGLRAELQRIHHLATAMAALRPTYDEVCGHDDPTPAYTTYLISVAARPGGCRPREIAAISGLSSASVSDLIARAEHGGCVTRMSLDTDGRAVIVTATEKGRATLNHVLARVAESVPTIAQALFPV